MDWLEKEKVLRRLGAEEERKNSIMKMAATLREIGLNEDDILSKLLQNYPEDDNYIHEMMQK